MAAIMGFGATILAVGLTVPVAEQRGGLSALLGEQLAGPSTAEPEVAEPEDASEALDASPPPPPTSCPQDMAALPKHDRVCIDKGEYPGLLEYPKTSVSLSRAAAACEERGRRLCTADEWKEACRGTTGRRQPYAGPYKDGHCNDALKDVPQNISRGGARETCVTPEGVFDLVGNAEEWVLDGEEGVVVGGNSTTKAASCKSRRELAAFEQDMTVGFRCCVSLAAPDAPADAPSPPTGADEGKPGRSRKRKGKAASPG